MLRVVGTRTRAPLMSTPRPSDCEPSASCTCASKKAGTFRGPAGALARGVLGTGRKRGSVGGCSWHPTQCTPSRLNDSRGAGPSCRNAPAQEPRQRGGYGPPSRPSTTDSLVCAQLGRSQSRPPNDLQQAGVGRKSMGWRRQPGCDLLPRSNPRRTRGVKLGPLARVVIPFRGARIRCLVGCSLSRR